MGRFASLVAAAVVSMVAGPALGQAQPAPVETTRIEVILANFSFTPANLTFRQGQHYMLRLVNQGSGGHNFASRELFAAVTLDRASEGLVRDGKVEVPKGGSVDIGFTATKPGSYPIRCTHFLHSGFGMKGNAVIQ